ncbi:IMP dehydrogenase [Patescibacteria group bacterium]|nr:IMP dehydrogenase [Patescibacteria group bacterium]
MAARFRGLALTFDDILLEPASSAVLPNEVKISTQVTKKTKINIKCLFKVKIQLYGTRLYL